MNAVLSTQYFKFVGPFRCIFKIPTVCRNKLEKMKLKNRAWHGQSLVDHLHEILLCSLFVLFFRVVNDGEKSHNFHDCQVGKVAMIDCNGGG